MSWMGPALQQYGPWSFPLIMILAFLVARSRGILITKWEMDRSDKRHEDSVQQTLKLYERQIDLGAQANAKKDETILRQSEQIERLLSHSHVSASALTSILGEARKRGLVPEEGE